MNNKTALLMALGLAFPVITFAQDGDQPRPPRRQRPAFQDDASAEKPNRPPRENAPADAERPLADRDSAAGGDLRRPPPPPLIAALDANHDGVIDEEEIKNASVALGKLDKNGDGKLTMDELRPERPDRNGPSSEDGGRRAVVRVRLKIVEQERPRKNSASESLRCLRRWDFVTGPARVF